MTDEKIIKAFSRLGHKAKRKKAEARRAKVKVLREKGYTGPQIAAELNIKIRTVYEDFKKIKQEKNAQDAPQRTSDTEPISEGENK